MKVETNLRLMEDANREMLADVQQLLESELSSAEAPSWLEPARRHLAAARHAFDELSHHFPEARLHYGACSLAPDADGHASDCGFGWLIDINGHLVMPELLEEGQQFAGYAMRLLAAYTAPRFAFCMHSGDDGFRTLGVIDLSNLDDSLMAHDSVSGQKIAWYGAEHGFMAGHPGLRAAFEAPADPLRSGALDDKDWHWYEMLSHGHFVSAEVLRCSAGQLMFERLMEDFREYHNANNAFGRSPAITPKHAYGLLTCLASHRTGLSSAQLKELDEELRMPLADALARKVDLDHELAISVTQALRRHQGTFRHMLNDQQEISH